jgi:hypothetical protein
MIRTLIVALALLSSAAPAMAYEKDCNCVELERRVNGLQTVISTVRFKNNYEREVVRKDLQDAQSYLRQVDYNRTKETEQERLCSLGAQACDNSWAKWQPWLAQNGYDRQLYCNDDKRGRDSDDRGRDRDQTVTRDGDRGCPSAQWKSQERAQDGLELNEGRNSRRFETYYDRRSSCYGYQRR